MVWKQVDITQCMANLCTFTHARHTITVRAYQDRADGTWFPITSIVTWLGWANDDDLIDTPHSYPTKQAALDAGGHSAVRYLDRLGRTGR
jgi:hypothetical protein